MISKNTLKVLSSIVFGFGVLSIFGSLYSWFASRSDQNPMGLSETQRFGLFVGLWPPTLFILSNYLDRLAREGGAKDIKRILRR